MVLVEMVERVDKNLLERFLEFDIEIDPVTCVLQKKALTSEVSADNIYRMLVLLFNGLAVSVPVPTLIAWLVA